MDFDRISMDEFMAVLDKVDYDNYATFISFKEALDEEINSESVYEDIIFYLEAELGYTCDADLKSLTQDNIDAILEAVNA